MVPPPLDALQRWMQSVLSHPAGVIAGARAAEPVRWSIGDIVTPSQQMSAEQRLAIYGHAYFARLLECLRAEYPAVHHAAGDEGFTGLCTAYLQSYPSRSDTLSELGRYFSEFLNQTRPPRTPHSPPLDFADFLIDLARLERCYSEVFDGPGPERLSGMTSETLASLTPEQFSAARLTFHGSVRLITLRFPCHDYATAVRQERDPSPPNAEPTPLVVFRKAYVVRRFKATPFQFQLLSHLQQGATVAAALEQAASFAGRQDQLAASVQRSFADWTAAPLFAGLSWTP